MNITTLGRGTIGGTLARLWTAAGHQVTELGRDGGDVAGADVVLVAVPYGKLAEALDGIRGLGSQVVIDATNNLGGERPPAGVASNAEYIKSRTSGPVAKSFNLNFGNLFEQAAAAAHRPQNIWTGDEEARAAVQQLSRDAGFEAVNAGPLGRAAVQEAFASLLMGIVKDVGDGLLFYRFAAPKDF